MDFIKTGGRIKYYRDLLHINPKELTMGRLTPTMIYLLENNKKKLTPITASILVSSFHEIANKKGVRINLEMKDFLMSDIDYANALCNKWIVEIEEDSFDEVKCLKIIELAKEYNLNEFVFKAYEKISYYHYNEKSYSKALKYFEELLPLSILINSQNDKINILNRIGTCYYLLLDYDKAFFYYKKGYEEFLESRIIDSELEDKLLYNLSLCSLLMKNFNNALMYMEKLESIANIGKSEIYTNLILKASIYMKIDRTEEALSIYKEILNYDIKYLYIVQNNIAVAFMRLGRLDESIEFFIKSINNQLDSLSPDTTISLIKLAEVYYKEKKYEEAFIFYAYGFENTKKFKQLDKLIQCYENIYKVCMEMCKINKFNFYYKSMGDLYSNLSFNEEQIKKIQILEHNYISNINY